MGILTNKIITLPCPTCGKAIKKTLGWFKANGRHCPRCGVAFDTHELRRALQQAEKTLADYERKARRL